MTKLEIRNIQRKYSGIDVLKNISCTLEEGHIYGLLGRNGVGKSTLLNIINNRVLPNKGEVKLDGEVIFEKDDLLAELFLVNDTLLFNNSDHLKVNKYFKLAKSFYPDFDEALCDHLVEVFELDGKQRIDKLSTGYRSILNVILGLCVPAKFIFFDEPTLGLDANHRELFYKELLDNFSKKTRTFVISTHLIEEVSHMIDTVLILNEGVISVNETAETILEKSWALTGAIRDIQEISKGLSIVGREAIGNQQTIYVYGNVGDIPPSIQVKSVDLQKIFIELTSMKERDWREIKQSIKV